MRCMLVVVFNKWMLRAAGVVTRRRDTVSKWNLVMRLFAELSRFVSNRAMPHTETFFFFFFNDTATPEFYPLSLHDPFPILFPLAIALVAPPRPLRSPIGNTPSRCCRSP